MMAKYSIDNRRLLCIVSIYVLCSSLFVITHAKDEEKPSSDRENELDITALPPEVAEIVAGISDVQKDIPKAGVKRKSPNIKVAGVTQETTTKAAAGEDEPDLELQLYEPEENESIVPNRLDQKTENGVTVTTEKTDDAEAIQEEEDPDSQNDNTENVEESDTSTGDAAADTPAGTDETEANPQEDQTSESGGSEMINSSLEPPVTSLLTYDGITSWYNWVMSMRDPERIPGGPLSWPTILGRGISSIVSHYNPLGSFTGRDLADNEVINSLSNTHPFREEIIQAIKDGAISSDVESINVFVHKLQAKKVADKISSMSRDDTIATVEDVAIATPLLSLRPLAAPIVDAVQNLQDAANEAEDALFAPLDVVPEEVQAAADLFDAPFSTVVAVPQYIKWINLGLKSLYILLPLLYLPFSGIENFFLAPLPPEMDTLPGFLRFFGLQAMLGPDYLYDYDYDDEDLAEDEAEAAAADAAVDDDYYYDDYDVRRKDNDARRNRRKDSKKKKKKNRKHKKEKADDKPVTDRRYSNLEYQLQPPPSKYGGYSSYSSVESAVLNSNYESAQGAQDPNLLYMYPSSDHQEYYPGVVQAPSIHQMQDFQEHYYDIYNMPGAIPYDTSGIVPAIPVGALVDNSYNNVQPVAQPIQQIPQPVQPIRQPVAVEPTASFVDVFETRTLPTEPLYTTTSSPVATETMSMDTMYVIAPTIKRSSTTLRTTIPSTATAVSPTVAAATVQPTAVSQTMATTV